MTDKFEFNLNEDGNVVIDKRSFETFLEQLEELDSEGGELFEKVFGPKKQYCCTVRFNGDFLEDYEYKEYPFLAHAKCIQHTLDRCGTVNGCSGTLRKGYCDE